MNDMVELPAELREYLGSTRRIWEFDDPSARWRFAKLYFAAEVPRVEFEVQGSILIPTRQTCEPRESSASVIVAYDLIAELDEETDVFGAIMWFPAFGEFGTWFAAKKCVLLYPGIELSDVLRCPTDYIFARGMTKRRIEPYAIPPWIHQSLDEERFQALIVRARVLQREATFQPDALKFALLATDRGRVVADDRLEAADYVANQLIRSVREYDGVVTACDKLLQTLPLAPQFACALINEAARYECNSGNEAAAIARLELALNEPDYTEYHNRFRKILDQLRDSPPQ